MKKELKPTTPVNETPLLKVTDDISDRTREIHDSISRRAFEIFEANGRVPGRDLEDWLQAESELLYPVCLDISESDDALVVRGTLPDFKARDIDIMVEPCRLTVAGKRGTQEGQVAEERVSAERNGAWILRTVDLPVQVNTERVTGRLRNGVLELTLPLAEVPTAKKLYSEAA